MDVIIQVEERRGCGYRKAGKDGVGIYMMSGGLSARCGLLPFPLEVCPCCGGGVKPSRSFTWITPELLFGQQPPLSVLADEERHCDQQDRGACRRCPVGGGRPGGMHGLVWIGEKFYKTPEVFMVEALALGVSRKLPAVPNGFEVGKTWIYLAHRGAVTVEGEPSRPGIFTAYQPTHVDLVIDDENEIPDRAKKLAERLGDKARIVKVIPEKDANGQNVRQMPLGGTP